MKTRQAWMLLAMAISLSLGASAQSQPSVSGADKTPPAAEPSAPAKAADAKPGEAAKADDKKADCVAADANGKPAVDKDGKPIKNPDCVDPNASETDQYVKMQDNPQVKSGSKKDVDAIGNRGMGKRGLGNWYSLESEIKLGREYSQMVESSSKLVTDPLVAEYVNRIGQNLVRNSDAKVPFTIKVIDSDEINAFALPGGFFYVNSGLILAADEESELAGVMAHEIAHVAARHAMKEMTRMQWANIGMIPLVIFGGTAGYIAYETSGITLPMTFMKFSRNFEAEADYLGVQYMYKAGYDPQSYVAFFEKIQAKEKKKPGAVAKVFLDHPPTPERIGATQKEISTILPAKESYVDSTSEFDEVKSRLAALTNKRRVDGVNKDDKKPSLRRKSNDDDKNASDDNADDRPTLKRRD